MVTVMMRMIMAVVMVIQDNVHTGDDGDDDYGDVDSYADEEKLDGVDYNSDDGDDPENGVGDDGGDGSVMVVMMIMTNDNSESLHSEGCEE